MPAVGGGGGGGRVAGSFGKEGKKGREGAAPKNEWARRVVPAAIFFLLGWGVGWQNRGVVGALRETEEGIPGKISLARTCGYG